MAASASGLRERGLGLRCWVGGGWGVGGLGEFGICFWVILAAGASRSSREGRLGTAREVTGIQRFS